MAYVGHEHAWTCAAVLFQARNPMQLHITLAAKMYFFGGQMLLQVASLGRLCSTWRPPVAMLGFGGLRGFRGYSSLLQQMRLTYVDT